MVGGITVKVLCLTNEFQGERFGGAGSTVTDMVEMLAQQGVEEVVIVPDSYGTNPSWNLQKRNLKVLRLPRNDRYFGHLGLINEGVVLEEFPELRSGWDLVHIYASNFAPLAYKVIRSGVPLLYSVMSLLRVELGNDSAPELQAQFEVQEELLARSRCIHLLSQSERRKLKERYPWLMPRVEVVPIGTHSSQKHWQGGIPNTLLYVGRLIEYKGIEDLLKASYLVKMQGKFLSLDVVGKGAFYYEQRLRNLVHLGQQVHFHGWEVNPSKIREWMLKSALLVVPSHRESFGLVALEGMSVGIPLIASDAAALAEFATSSCALTYPVGDIEALAGKITYALDHPQFMRALSHNAINRAASFEWSKLMPKYLELYRKMTKSSQ